MKRIVLLLLLLIPLHTWANSNPDKEKYYETKQRIQVWIEQTFKYPQYGVFENEIILNVAFSAGKKQGLVLCDIKITVQEDGTYSYTVGAIRHYGNGWVADRQDLGELKPLAEEGVSYIMQALDDYLTLEASNY